MGNILSSCCDINQRYTQISEETVSEALTQQPPLSAELGVKVFRDFMDFSFLKDDTLGSVISERKFMIILRGPPGSGKSTLAGAIITRFPRTKHHSADHFYISDGSYVFNPQKIQDAHKWCLDETKNSLMESYSPILIDNTNIKKWEMNNYIKLAKLYRYFIIILTPQTPWLFNAEALSKKNVHNVTEETIERKISAFENAYPTFLGLFLLPDPSKSCYNPLNLNTLFADFCSQAVYQMLRTNLVFKYFRLNPESTLEELLKKWKNTNDSDILGMQPASNRSPFHVTLFYIGKCNTPEAKEFVTRFEYTQALHGLLFNSICLGITISNRTIGARIMLPFSESNLLNRIYGQDDFESADGLPITKDKRWKGCRTHFTIGIADYIQPVETGIDMLRLCDRINFDHLRVNPLPSTSYPKPISLEQGQLWTAINLETNDTIFYYHLNKPMTLSSITGGYY